MRSFAVTHPLDQFLIIAAIFLFFASCVVRIRIFRKESSDQQLNELVKNASIIGFGDLLAFHLAMRWRRLSRSSKTISAVYVASFFIALLSLAIGVTSAYVRA